MELEKKERVPVAKLQWEAVKWLASKRVPELYGDGVKMNFTALSDEELIQLAAEYGISLTDPAPAVGRTDRSQAGSDEPDEADLEEPLQ